MDPAHGYYCSLDVKSLYTSCNMHTAVDIVMEKIRSNLEILPANITPEGINSLLHFSLDNAYLEFDSLFYRQNTGGPMGSPLTVALAEIRVSYIEDMAIRHSTDPPSYGGGGLQPHFCPWKNVCFPIFSHREKWGKKYMEREGNEYFSLSFHILFFPFFPMGKNRKAHIFIWAKMGLDPPPYY